MWFTENPWPPLVFLVTIACVLVGMWANRKQSIWLAGAILCLLAAPGVYYAERQIVTDRERIEGNVRQMAQAFQRRDGDATLSYFSLQDPDLRSLVQVALRDVVVDKDLRISDIDVRVYNENSQADATFRATAAITYQSMPVPRQPSRWLTRWQKEGHDWKVVEVQRLSTTGNEPLSPFDTRQ